jgi:hypothetical protein
VNVRHTDDSRPDPPWRPLVRASLAAIRDHPTSTWAIAAGALRFARRSWWRRSPFLPIPDDRYWRFRMETVYGDERANVTPSDVAEAARWSRRVRSARR